MKHLTDRMIKKHRRIAEIILKVEEETKRYLANLAYRDYKMQNQHKHRWELFSLSGKNHDYKG